jgi:hypothetical protein
VVAKAQPLRSQAIAELLAHAIDYAGLYPPAALAMADAVEEYARQRVSPHAWALGRFVVGMDQLSDFIAARRHVSGGPWPLSVLVTRNDGPHGRDLSTDTDILRVEAVEAKATSPAEVQQLEWLQAIAPELHVEIPPEGDLTPLLIAVRSLGARAKIRTGGVTAGAIPSAETVALFMHSCVAVGVPFKATAGLHHLLRGEYPLTYEAGSARATMFGFLNVFVAASLAVNGAALNTLTQVLEEPRLRAFQFDANGGVCWREHCLSNADVRRARKRGITGFGSCSFAEPIAELTQARLVDA